MTEKERVLAEWAEDPTVKIHITQTAEELKVSRNGDVPSFKLWGQPKRVRRMVHPKFGMPLWATEEFQPRRAKTYG